MRAKLRIVTAGMLCLTLAFGGCTTTGNDSQATTPVPTVEETTEEMTTEEATTEEVTTAAPTVEELRAMAAADLDRPTMYFYNRHNEYVEFTPEPEEVTGMWNYYGDICLYTVFASKEAERIAYGEFRDLYARYWDSFAEAGTTKIGYELIIHLKEGEPLIETILSPEDVKPYFSYIEVYLYDDYHHAYGEWYSHLEEESMAEDTYITGIKLTTGEKVEEVESVTLSVFTYQNTTTEFDPESQRYIGGNLTSVRIVRE